MTNTLPSTKRPSESPWAKPFTADCSTETVCWPATVDRFLFVEKFLTLQSLDSPKAEFSSLWQMVRMKTHISKLKTLNILKLISQTWTSVVLQVLSVQFNTEIWTESECLYGGCTDYETLVQYWCLKQHEKNKRMLFSLLFIMFVLSIPPFVP